jgi:hypothetical protein
MYRTFRYAGWKSQSAYADFVSLAAVLTTDLGEVRNVGDKIVFRKALK